ncbi:MAG: WbqC family protein [Luteimonas sp.]
MKAAIMQPYLFPYIGYFQLIKAVDVFIVYDNIQYTKKGWINRNRFLHGGSDAMFSLPLKNDSGFLDVRERKIATDFNRNKLLNQLRDAYRKAPHFAATFALVEDVLACDETNLFLFLHQAIQKTCDHLGIDTPIVVSSTIDIDHGLQGESKVLALCEAVGADAYINSIGGQELYSRETFGARGIALAFLRSTLVEYPQFEHAFVPWLSIIDVMMFNPRSRIDHDLVNGYTLV